MSNFTCELKEQGYSAGSCSVKVNEKRLPACQATLRYENDNVYRLITSIHLSRPENYLSIYQSGCNFSCRKCHSWYFSQIKQGDWYTPEQILEEAVAYEKLVTLVEPRAKATAWHAYESCRCCVSPQGFGPARNIVAFTGGEVTCCPEFYGKCARLIKKHTKLLVLIETNGYGLTPQNLDYLKESGVDAFWLDIKAFDPEKHKWLTGCANDHILNLPAEMLKRDFVLEVLSLYIPGLVEAAELESIARKLAEVDATIPFTILAFFPEYQMKDFATPSVVEMIEAYQRVKATGLQQIRLGNVGTFARTEEDRQYLMAHVEREGY